MEVNYLLIFLTTAIAFCVIVALRWKGRRDLRLRNPDRPGPKGSLDEDRQQNKE